MNQKPTFFTFAHHHSSLIKQLGYMLVVFTILTSIYMFYSTKQATIVLASQTTVPHYAHAWYIKNPDTASQGAMYTLGYNDGARDNSNCTNAAVLLDYGQVDYQAGGSYGGYGIYKYGGPFISDTVVEQATERYANGWFRATGNCPRLHVIIGYNNYAECRNGGSCNITTAGQQWGNVVNNVENWLINSGWTWQMNAFAGGNLEQPSNTPGNYYWDCATKTKYFVDGFNSNNPSSARYFDFGSAWVPDNYPTQNCWVASDVYHVAYQAAADYPLPELYHLAALQSWMNLGYYMYYEGELTDCNQPDEITGNTCSGSDAWSPSYAWQQLWNSVSSQGSLDYSTNIKYQGQ